MGKGFIVAAMCALAFAGVVGAQQAAPSQPARSCRAFGHVLGGDHPLPGVAITVMAGEKTAALTSTDVDGGFAVALAPGTYRLKVELTAFVPVEKDITLAPPGCETQADVALVLTSRASAAMIAAAPQPTTPATITFAPARAPATAPAAGGRGAAQASRFQMLNVQQSTSADVESATLAAGIESDPAARLLPAGFSLDAPSESITVNGSMVDMDRAQMADRMQALARGDFGLSDAQFTQGGPGGGELRGGRGGPGGRGGAPGLGGRAGGANRLQASATYNLGSSLFDAAPYALRDQTQSQPDYTQQTASFTLGGPLKIPGLYGGSRTTFNFSYSGNRNGNAFDQYATVPSDAIRRGDFSALRTAVVNPTTGQPFPGNQVPVSAAARELLTFIPSANLSGDTRNFHNTGVSRSTSNQFTLRITHSLTAPPAGRGGRGGPGGSGGGRPGQAAATPATPATPASPATPAAGRQAGPGPATGSGRGGRGNLQAPLSVTLNATVTYRQNRGDRLNVFPTLNGATSGFTLSVPATLNVRKGRTTQTFNASFSRTHSETLTPFAFNDDVAGRVGIGGVATDPFDWGVPTISFGNFTGLRSASPARRTDRSWQASYSWQRPAGAHNLRAGASAQWSSNTTQSDTNPNGSFTFTGLYATGGKQAARGSGLDFADFLLGLPQQATRQYSLSPNNITLPIEIRGQQYSVFLNDDWRLKPRWTLNWGLQYDYVAPFTEADGHMVNLDVAPGFTAVAPVFPDEGGTFSGAFPIGLVYPDTNNFSPRVGAAWRATNRSAVRFGYGLTYNTGSYAAIARQLYQQPPFFLTGTAIGSVASPLTLTDAFSSLSPSTVTNSYGIDKNYELGMIHQFSVDYNRDLFRSWNAGATYVGTRGRQLDMLRAPNRGPDGLRIAGVDPFTWQSAEGASHANGLSFRLQKRQTKGIAGTVTYTLSKSMDNTTATGGGATVAQDDQNLAAEWALSNFDQRHQLAGNLSWQLPWGVNRAWLSNGGYLASIVGDWSLTANLTWNSGTPLTVRCSTCASDVARGTGGTLRANYNGLPIDDGRATLDEFFNTSAFTVPASGTFGNSARNMILGPGSRQLNTTFTRDVVLGGSRGVTIQVSANNLLNTVNYAAIDTNVNSSSFGQVLGVRGMRTVRVNMRFRF